MAEVVNIVSVRNGGTRMTGLSPTWVLFKRLDNNADLTPPAISEVGQGLYKFSYDAEGAGGEAVGQIDAGSGVTAAADRYIDVVLTADSSRIGGAPARTVTTLLATAVPNTNTAGTVADALNAARAQGFGRWALVGTTLTLYGSDNTTPVRTFAIDNAAAPTSRT